MCLAYHLLIKVYHLLSKATYPILSHIKLFHWSYFRIKVILFDYRAHQKLRVATYIWESIIKIALKIPIYNLPLSL